MSVSREDDQPIANSFLERIASLSADKRALLAQENPLSFAQQRLWFVEQLTPGTPVYNLPTNIPLSGPFHLEALERALQELVRRHDTLRTCFPAFDGTPLQLVLPDIELPLCVHEIMALPVNERGSTFKRLVNEEIRRPFDVVKGPLLRVSLFKLEPGHQMLLVVIHHIVSDGWSQGILTREVLTLYHAFREGRPSPLPPLPLRYLDFAVWQRQWLQGAVLERQLAYWRERLGGASDLELPTDRPRPSVQSFRGALRFFHFSNELNAALQALCQETHSTPFMLLLAAFKVLLHRYTGQEDIVVGSPIANRNRNELEGLIGFFVNTLVLRTRFKSDQSFLEVLKQVRETALGAYDHQDLPFEKLVEELNPRRDLSRNPFVQVVFAVQNTPGSEGSINAFKGLAMGEQDTPTRFDLELHVWETDGELVCAVYYSRDLFEANTIERMLRHWETLLRGIVADPGRHVSEYPLMEAEERRRVVEEWNRTQVPFPETATVQACFEEQVVIRPEAVALVSGAEHVTYRELNVRANRYAHWLREAGVGPEDTVGLLLQRSVDQVAALLGILKAGGAYLPLEPSYPQQRLAQLLQDSKPKMVLVEKGLQVVLPETDAPVAVIEDLEESLGRRSVDNGTSEATARNLAYVMYTSGSTGVPKGVCVEHRNVVRLVKSPNYVELGPETVGLYFAPLAFDASTFELFGPLLNGGRLVVYPPELPSLDELAGVIEANGVNTLWLTAGLFHQMAEGALEKLQGVWQWLAGGDVLNPGAARRVLEALPKCTLINGYGPTECTTFSTAHVMRRVEDVTEPVSIGRPLQNARVYVLDEQGEPTPVGVPGELYIGGVGVSRGYLNSPEQTAQRFVPDRFNGQTQERLYKSGDLVRWREDGTLEFLGRRDAQVKLRGFRIELGEIESVLCEHPEVAQAAVILREDTPGDKRLAAYIVPVSPSGCEAQILRNHLKMRVPAHQVPQTFTFLDKLRLTENGKLDRRALPVPEMPGSTSGYVAPRTPTEAALAELWEKIISREKIGVHDNFFDCGGHSLSLIQLVSEVNQRFTADIPLQTIFAHATIAEMAAWLDGSTEQVREPQVERHELIIPIREHGARPPLFCIPPAGGTAFPYYNLAHNLGDDQPVYALQDPSAVRDGRPCDTIEAMAESYFEAIRTVQPHGPYCLIGWSFGGIVAVEVARKALDAGERVGMVGLIEAILPRQGRRTGWERIRNFPSLGRSLLRLARSGLGTTLDGYHAIIHHMRQTRDEATGDRSWRGRLEWLWRNVVWSLFLKRVDLAHVMSEEARLVLIRQPSARDFGRISKANVKALSRFTVPPYPGKVIVFRGDHHPKYGCADEPAQGWAPIAQGGVDVHVVPGDHFSIIRNPHVLRLSEEVRLCLDVVEQPDRF